ncbi:MAG TPA: hypothetical protein VJR29_08000, partial [bacterium]|nr:hypothetical protein [bacterium]
QNSGFSQKPARLDELLASNLDPDTGTLPQPLPFAATLMKDNYTHVLYEPGATFDLYLKTLAMQLALELGSFLPWSFSDYRASDLAVLLDGRQMFRYFPAGSAPWGAPGTVEDEGYDAAGSTPAPPLVAMKFLLRQGVLRNNRWETLGQWLEWERNKLQHTLGSPQSLTGECGKEFHEVYWGTKGAQPAAFILHGTAMACALVPVPGSGSTQEPTFNPAVKHYTGGCGTTGALNHRMMRQLNIVAEPVAFTHGQTRFAVERTPFQAMLDALEPLLPAEPAIDDGLSTLSSSLAGLAVASKIPGLGSNGESRNVPSPLFTTSFTPGSGLLNAYIDHNDNPYGMTKLPEAAMPEALIDETTYRRWFPEPPPNLSGEQRSQFFSAHNKRVSLRPTQLRIAKIPLHTMQYYCWKQDAGKPHGETETYEQFFAGTYTVEELESTGFWQRLEQKLNEAGGCEGLPPMY